MGSILTYRCPSCAYATPQLNVGWGKAGRAAYWGGLALCPACKELGVVNLGETRAERRDRRCTRCNGPLKLIEDTGDTIPCPQCGKGLLHTTVGSWN